MSMSYAFAYHVPTFNKSNSPGAALVTTSFGSSNTLRRPRFCLPEGRPQRSYIARHPSRIVSQQSNDSQPSTASADVEATLVPDQSLAFRPFRKLLLALALAGTAETCYLTFNKLFSDPGAICATEGCLDVLSGPFSTFLGVPLTLYGALSYAVFAYLCVWPLCVPTEAEILKGISEGADSDEQAEKTVIDSYEKRDSATRPLMLALSTIQFIFSMYLVSLLTFVIKSMCPYCVFSASLSTLMFLFTAFIGRAVPAMKSALKIGAASSAASALAIAAFFSVSWPAHIRAQPPSEPQAPPAVTAPSTSDTMRIAQKLKLKNTKMYGAYWCSHCFDQKQRFGKRAFDKIEYIECDKYGVNTKFQLCRDKRIPGYPTWEIDGQLFPGEIEPAELERLVDDESKD